MHIAIVGCGNMGSGLAKRLSQTCSVFLYDHSPSKAQALAQAGFGTFCPTLKDAFENAELVILAIKPQSLEEAVNAINAQLQPRHIFVSLLAGTTLASLKNYFPKATLVRMMPNLALIYGEGVIGLSADKMLAQLTEVFEPLGKIYWLPEKNMNALTALTGSGPAFFLTMIEAMVDAGIAMGFDSKSAQSLVQQMLQGTLALLEQSQLHPGELKWQITSPQGTTIAGIKQLETNGLRGNVIGGFWAAYERAEELAKNKTR